MQIYSRFHFSEESKNKGEDGKNKEIERREYLSSSESADESKSIENGCSIWAGNFFLQLRTPQKDSNYSFDFFAIFAVGFPKENTLQAALDTDVHT